jgi:hypothetical protein
VLEAGTGGGDAVGTTPTVGGGEVVSVSLGRLGGGTASGRQALGALGDGRWS